MGGLTQKSGFDTRFESYAPFYDEQWNNEFMHLVTGTKLEQASFDMARTWRAASDARSLPWLMAQCFDGVFKSLIMAYEPSQRVFIRQMKEQLVKKVGEKGRNISPVLARIIEEALSEMDEGAEQKMQRIREQQLEKMEAAWNINMQCDSVRMSLWSSERMAYCSLYYNYEFFLGECVRIKKGLRSYRISAQNFKDDFEAAFGTSLLANCWSDREINFARLARHAIAHAGGRETDNLRSQQHPFEVQGKEIQIFAPETTALYVLLKGRARLLAEAAVAMPEFAGE